MEPPPFVPSIDMSPLLLNIRLLFQQMSPHPAPPATMSFATPVVLVMLPSPIRLSSDSRSQLRLLQLLRDKYEAQRSFLWYVHAAVAITGLAWPCGRLLGSIKTPFASAVQVVLLQKPAFAGWPHSASTGPPSTGTNIRESTDCSYRRYQGGRMQRWRPTASARAAAPRPPSAMATRRPARDGNRRHRRGMTASLQTEAIHTGDCVLLTIGRLHEAMARRKQDMRKDAEYSCRGNDGSTMWNGCYQGCKANEA
jgi:hypothetical protein